MKYAIVINGKTYGRRAMYREAKLYAEQLTRALTSDAAIVNTLNGEHVLTVNCRSTPVGRGIMLARIGTPSNRTLMRQQGSAIRAQARAIAKARD